MTVKVIEGAPMLELLDPKRIIVKNVREAKPDKEFIESIRELGNVQPIGVLRTADNELVLRFGLQRLHACIETDRKVLAMVVDGTTGTDEAEIERIFLQLAENDRRRDLTAAERAGAVEALFAYGADARTVSRRTGLDKSEIAAARKAAASETARTLAAQYPLTIDQAAVIAEFDDDQETAVQLAEFARDEPSQFAHAAQQAREDRAEAAMIAAHAAKLTELGSKVVDRAPDYEKRVSRLAGEDGQPLTEESHRGCPGSVVALHVEGYGDRQHVAEVWYCTDPSKYRHVKRVNHGTAPERSRDEAAAERRKVLENNKAWRAATAVRTRWLRDVLLARKTVPDGAALFIARAIAAADHHTINAMSTMSGGKHKTARELLGVGQDSYIGPGKYATPLVDSLSAASEQRAQVVTLALVLGAFEGLTADPQTWRSVSPAASEYLSALAGWGYPLSPIEQGVIDTAAAVDAVLAAATRSPAATAPGTDGA